MQVDPRLSLDPSSVAHRRAQEAREDQIRRLHSAALWVLLVDPLVDILLARAEDSPMPPPVPLPADLDAGLVTSWCGLAQSLLGQATAVPSNADAHSVLSEKIGTRIAERATERPELWDAILEALSNNGRAYSAFCDSLDPQAIRSNIAGLTALPADINALYLTESLDPLRPDQSPRYRADRLAEVRAQSSDLWAYVEETTRGADEAALSARLRGRSRLLFRAAEEDWLVWLAALPLPLLAAAVLRDIEDLDLIERLISHRLATVGAGEDWVMALLVRHALDLWKRVDQQLTWASDPDRWGYAWPAGAIDVTAYESQLGEWRTIELPQRAGRVATMIAGSAVGRTTAILALRHLFEWNWQPRKSRAVSQVIGRVRDALADALVGGCSDVPALVSEVLGGSKVPAALIGGATLVAASEGVPVDQWASARRQILDGYRDWLLSDSCIWSQPLRDDEFNLGWMLARLLAAGEEPAFDLHRLLASCEVPMEGWFFNWERLASSIPRLAHVLTVGALATEWLARVQRVDQARCLFALVWERLHRLMRSTAQHELVAPLVTPLSEIWARLWLVWHDAGDGLALGCLPMMDRIEWLLVAATNFSRNRAADSAGQKTLPAKVQGTLRRRFDELFRTWSLRFHVSQRDMESYLAEIEQLAPNQAGESIPKAT